MFAALLMIALAPLNNPAPFADYVISVPLRIENMRNVVSAQLNCGIYHWGTDRVDLTTPGTGTAAVPIAGGAYTGTVTVTVNVTDSRATLNPPTNWMCMLVYRWRNPDGTIFSESLRGTAERATAYTRGTGQEISENVTEISGPIPPP